MKNKPGIETGGWKYIESGPGAGVFTGKFEIRLHWPGTATSQEIRDTCRLIVESVNSRADLIQERDRLREVNADLLAACEALTSSLDAMKTNSDYLPGEKSRALWQSRLLANAAIAKAKGQA